MSHRTSAAEPPDEGTPGGLLGEPERMGLAEWMTHISDGNVTKITRHGPLFGRPPRNLKAAPGTFVPTLSRRDKTMITVLGLGWVAFFAYFWTWWLNPAHRVGWMGLI